MTAAYRSLKIFAPLVLAVFFSSVLASSGFGQETPDYTLSAPANVNKGDTFDLKVSSAKGPLDQKDVSVILPSGFENAMSSPTVSPDGSLVYKIKAAPDEGDGDIMVQINSSAGVQSLSRKIGVQRPFLETYQPFLITIGVLVLISLVVGGMAKSSSGSGSSMY
jgi:hypothetical protein